MYHVFRIYSLRLYGASAKVEEDVHSSTIRIARGQKISSSGRDFLAFCVDEYMYRLESLVNIFGPHLVVAV